MDHHCDAIGVCVALRNRKIFLLFIFYGIILVGIYGGTALVLMFVLEFEEFPSHLLIDGFIGGSLAIFVSWLLAVQMRNVLTGRTAIERELGIVVEDGMTKWERLVDVFGPLSIKWFLPVPLEYGVGSAFRWEELEVGREAAEREAAEKKEIEQEKEKTD
jgi:hypothetical protein